MSTQPSSRIMQLLAAARERPPVRYDVERGLARHRQLLGSTHALPEWAARVPKRRGAGRSWLAKAGVGVLLVAGSVALWQPRATPPRVSSPRTIPAPVVAAPQPLAPPERATPPQASDLEQASSPPASTLAGAPRRTVSARRASAPKQPPAAAQPASRDRVPASDGRVSGAPQETSAPEVQRFEIRPFARDDTAPDAEELRWLTRAEAALRDDPARALSLLREGDVRFARGYFGEERAYLAVLATRALGRHAEARALARAFLASHPRSPYAGRVRASAAD